MAAVTLTTLCARARERADMVDSLFVTDSADSLWAFINEGIQELHDLLVETYGADYDVSSSSFSTVAGTATVALPSDFYKLLGVDLTFQGRVLDLKKYNFKERNFYRNVNSSELPVYRVEGSNLRFYPTPASVMTGTIWYAPTKALLASGASTVNFPNGWERYVVLHAAIACLKKEESDATGLEREKATLRGHIIQMAANRDASEPERAVDTDMAEVDPYSFYY